MLTAGHCGSGAWTQGGRSFGSTSQLLFGGRADEQVIPVSSVGSYIFSDPTSTTRKVTGVASSDPIGTLLCTDGYSDREVCSVRVDAIGQMATYGVKTVTGLVKAHQTGGAAAFSGGDSGGPIGATTGSTSILAFGMICAMVTGNASIGYYMPARFIQLDMGVTVKV